MVGLYYWRGSVEGGKVEGEVNQLMRIAGGSNMIVDGGVELGTALGDNWAGENWLIAP